MESIDYYIEKSKTMENTSDGGSPSYLFDDVVLIKYYLERKYGISRPEEEMVSYYANEKRKKGVNTPYHYSIKRVIEEKNDVCYVLQERAKGKCLKEYCNKNPKEQLEIQRKFLKEPIEKYEKCVRDLIELHNMGLELKPKNIFYDFEDTKNGVYFIDLLGFNPKNTDYKDLSELNRLIKNLKCVYSWIMIPYYADKSCEEEKEESQKIYYDIVVKILKAVETIIPSYKKYKRWIFRTFDKDMLNYFKEQEIINDLTLSDSEYLEYSYMIYSIIDTCIENIMLGKENYTNCVLNTLRIQCSKYCLEDSYYYHKDCQTIKKENNKSKWDFDYKIRENFENKLINVFNDRLIEVSQKNESNEYLQSAIQDMNERNKRYNI